MSSKLNLCDQIVFEEFKNNLIVDDEGVAHKVPIILGTDEKAEIAMVLPFMNLYLVEYVPCSPVHEFSIQYKLNCYTLYVQDMNQVVEQILLKFTPSCPTSKLGYKFPLELKKISNNLGLEKRLVKYSFDFELTANFKELEDEKL